MFKKTPFSQYFPITTCLALMLLPLNALAAICSSPNGDSFKMTLDPTTAVAGKSGIVLVGQHKEIRRYTFSSNRATGVLTYNSTDERTIDASDEQFPLKTIHVSSDFRKITIRVGQNENGPEFEDLVCK